jgi:hypothetical protein
MEPLFEPEATCLTPFALFFMGVISVLLMGLPRKYAVVPLLITVCYMTLGQRLVVAGLNFTVIRVVLLVGWLRVLMRGETRSLKLVSIDRVFIAWNVVCFFAGVLLTPNWQGVQNRLGFAYNALGAYFLVRCLVTDSEEFEILLKAVLIACVPLCASMLVEKLTQRNAFAILGGVPEVTVVREGRLRCQGPFAHPILVGTFGASVFPLFVGLWRYWAPPRHGRCLAAIGGVSAMVIMIASASSGPLLVWMVGVGSLLLWPKRQSMRTVRWGILLGLMALQLVMKSPVWWVIGRLDSFTGGTGYHRSYLIDQWIRHFSDWWLIGTNYTAEWSPTAPLPIDPNNADITSQYILEAVNGGMLTLILFVCIIVGCYKAIGRAIRTLDGSDVKSKFLLWTLGCSLTVHVFSFISVAYFDQMIVFYYLILAVITGVATRKVRALESEIAPVDFAPAGHQSQIPSGDFHTNCAS